MQKSKKDLSEKEGAFLYYDTSKKSYTPPISVFKNATYVKAVISSIIIILCFFLSLPIAWGEAYLDIISIPEGVSISINGKIIGDTPLTGIEVPAGEIKIYATKHGYGSATKVISLKNDDLKTIRINLNPTIEQTGEKQGEVTIKQDRGSLLVINKKGNTPVYIDGKKKGMGSIKIDGISAGKHKIAVTGHERSIKIYKDHTLKVEINGKGIYVLNDLDEIEYRKKQEAQLAVEQLRLNQEEAKKKDAIRKSEEKNRKEKASLRTKLRNIYIVDEKDANCPPGEVPNWASKSLSRKCFIDDQRETCKYANNSIVKCYNMQISGEIYFFATNKLFKNPRCGYRFFIYIDGKNVFSRKNRLKGIKPLNISGSFKHDGMKFTIKLYAISKSKVISNVESETKTKYRISIIRTDDFFPY